MSMNGMIPLRDLVKDEMIQRRQEGCAVPEYDVEHADEKELERIYEELCRLNVSPDFPFDEPDDLDEILAASAGCTYKKEPDRAGLYAKFAGAWMGRVTGCIMGKPVECWPFGSGSGEFDGWECIRLWQEGASDTFPPVDYISGKSTAREKYGFGVVCPDSQRENIRFAESDDDIRYLVLGLLINSRYGNDFTADDVADMWHGNLTPSMCFTAERAAYINSLICEETDAQRRLEFCRKNKNPYREWIGAQIRIDHYGYYNAGDPLSAAKAAFSDASLSHVKNGVYGAMFFAALTAAAFTENDVKKCIETALTVIPRRSRLYGDILFAVEAAENSETPRELYEKLWNRFRGLHPVHTNNNAAVCVAALVMGKGDFLKSVSVAVGAGWDTDCNGATVGSVSGAMNGIQAIPEHLKAPLNDTLYSSIPDFHPADIMECAERTYQLFMSKE